MATNQLVEGLHQALNREVSTALRYIVQSAMIRGHEWMNVRENYRNEVSDEIGHAQYLADKIAMLGGTPEIKPELPSPPSDIRQMLMYDIEQERIDEAQYMRLAVQAGEQGHAELKIKLEEQAADEAQHGESMRRLLG